METFEKFIQTIVPFVTPHNADKAFFAGTGLVIFGVLLLLLLLRLKTKNHS